MAYDLGLAERIHCVLTRRNANFVEKKMFGGVCYMVNGNMCCGIVRNDLMLRMSPEQATASLLKPHTRPMDFAKRPMKGMIYVDPHGTDSDEALEAWIEQSLAFVKALAAKPAKEALKKPPPRAALTKRAKK